MPYVFSTLANDQIYQGWDTNPDTGINAPSHRVHIKGGAGVANDRLVTPAGVATEVSNDDLEFIKKNPVFKVHVNNGYITISAKKAEVETVVKDMNKRDKSAPATPESLSKDLPEGMRVV